MDNTAIDEKVLEFIKKKYKKKKGGLTTSEIILGLRLSPDVILDSLSRLRKSKKIKLEDIKENKQGGSR